MERQTRFYQAWHFSCYVLHMPFEDYLKRSHTARLIDFWGEVLHGEYENYWNMPEEDKRAWGMKPIFPDRPA